MSNNRFFNESVDFDNHALNFINFELNGWPKQADVTS